MDILNLKREYDELDAMIYKAFWENLSIADTNRDAKLICNKRKLDLEVKKDEVARKLAEITGEEYAIKYDLSCLPEAAVSGAVLLESEQSSYLTFNAMKENELGDREDYGTAIVKLISPIKTTFGQPNDEALRGHPLYDKGLSGYNVCKVLNSKWRESIITCNRIAFPENEEWPMRHFIISFHDSCFECLATDLEVKISNEKWNDIAHNIINLFGNE